MLLEAGHDVALMDITTDSAYASKLEREVTVLRASVGNWAVVMEAVNSFHPDVIVHAGAVLPPLSEQSPQLAFQVNIEGSYYILEAARILGCRQVIYASSVASFGPDAPADLVPNDFAQHPTGIYGVSKVCTERLGEYYATRYGLDFRAVRFPALFGPGRAASSGWTAFTSVAIEESAKGNPYAFKVAPATATGILYVRDAARSLLDLSNGDSSRLTRRSFNIHGFLASAQDLHDAILRHVPDAQLSFAPDEQITAFVNSIPKQIDDSLARAQWDWQPRFDLDTAVADFVATVRSRQ
jgi:nucleoside-diphosphate-sugar epimerase